MEDVKYYQVTNGQVTVIPVAEQRWRVEALYDCSLHPVIEYDGSDYDALSACIGGLCLSMTVDKITIYRNNEQHRRIELK